MKHTTSYQKLDKYNFQQNNINIIYKIEGYA